MAPLFWVLPRSHQGPRILCGAPCLNERENLNVEQISAKRIKAWEGGPEEKENKCGFFFFRLEKKKPFHIRISEILCTRGE